MSEVDEKVDKLNNAKVNDVPLYVSVREPNQPATPKKKKNTAIFAVIIVLALAYLGRNDIANVIDMDMFSEETPETIFNPADIHLYTFSDPYDNNSVNVEFRLLNTGGEIATEIEAYVRVRDHNGTILFSEVVDTTALLLRGNETCSGDYVVEYDDAEYITHTVELSWYGGRNSYSKTTNL